MNLIKHTLISTILLTVFSLQLQAQESNISPKENDFAIMQIDTGEQHLKIGNAAHIPGLILWVGGQAASFIPGVYDSDGAAVTVASVIIAGAISSHVGLSFTISGAIKYRRGMTELDSKRNFSLTAPLALFYTGQGFRLAGYLLNTAAVASSDFSLALAGVSVYLAGFIIRDIISWAIFTSKTRQMKYFYSSADEEPPVQLALYPGFAGLNIKF